MSVVPFACPLSRRISRQYSPTDRLAVSQSVSLSILVESRNLRSKFAAVENVGDIRHRQRLEVQLECGQIAHSAKRSAKRCGICRKTLGTSNAGGSGGKPPDPITFFLKKSCLFGILKISIYICTVKLNNYFT